MFNRASLELGKLLDNQSTSIRLDCGCHIGIAKVTPELSKGIEDFHRHARGRR